SAGPADTPDLVELTEAPLSEPALMAAVEDGGAGAIVLFSGVVRDQTGGRRVNFLEDAAAAPMAVAKMREIAAAARTRFPGIRKLALVHRIGRLEIGESRVLIAVSTAHRGEAFGGRRL